MTATIGYYISAIPQPHGQLVCATEDGHLFLSTTPLGALRQLRRLILAEPHPLLVLRGYMVGLRCESEYPAGEEQVGVNTGVQVKQLRPTIPTYRALQHADNTAPTSGAGHDFAAHSGVVASCRRLEDSVGSGYDSLMQLWELATMHWRRSVRRTLHEWLGYYIHAGWRDAGRNIARLWQQHITLLVDALGGDTIIQAGQPVPVEGYTKAVELAFNRLSSRLDEDERIVMDAMFYSTCTLLGRRFAALGHRYHEGQGLVTILAVAAAVAALVAPSRKGPQDDRIIMLRDVRSAAQPLPPLAASFQPLFEMLKAGGVAAVYSSVGGGVARLAGLPLASTLVERVKVAAYYANSVTKRYQPEQKRGK